MTRLARSEEGGLILPNGQTGRLVANEDAFAREILGLPTAAPPAAAAPAAPAAAAAAAAGPAVKEEGAGGTGAPRGAPLLDSKPHEPKAEPEAPAAAAAAAGPAPGGVPASGSQLALPQLAGECWWGWGWAASCRHCWERASSLASCCSACSNSNSRATPLARLRCCPPAGEEELAAPSMPGANFFTMFMQQVLLPRGPPEFLVKAFNRDRVGGRAGWRPRLLQLGPASGGRLLARLSVVFSCLGLVETGRLLACLSVVFKCCAWPLLAETAEAVA